MSAVLRDPVDAMTRLKWQELDHLLVQLWTTRSIRSAFTHDITGIGTSLGALVQKLLPELVSRGFGVV